MLCSKPSVETKTNTNDESKTRKTEEKSNKSRKIVIKPDGTSNLKIIALGGLDEIAKLPGVVSVNPSYREGETVTGEGTLKQIICRFFIVSDTKQELIDTIDKIYDLLIVVDEDGNDMKIGRFNTQIVDELY